MEVKRGKERNERGERMWEGLRERWSTVLLCPFHLAGPQSRACGASRSEKVNGKCRAWINLVKGFS